jgi:predicted DNA-binding transcriptional regulator AlpA
MHDMTDLTDGTLNGERLLTRAEVGALVGLGGKALRRALNAPDAPEAIVFNARVIRYRRGEIQSWLDRRTCRPERNRTRQRREAPVPGHTTEQNTGQTAQRMGRPRKHVVATRSTR